MNSEAVAKAQRFADIAYSAARDDIQREFRKKLADARALLASRGLARSSAMNAETTNLHAEWLKAQLEARVNALLEGYGLHGIELNETIAGRVIQDVESLAAQSLGGMTSSVKGQASLIAARTGMNAEPFRGAAAEFEREMERRKRSMIKEIKVQIERKRLRVKTQSVRPDTTTVTNIYYLHGHSSRVNVQSTDNSINVVRLSNDEVFVKLREEISSRISSDQQLNILDRLDALERAQNSPSFAARYADFISAAADHMTLIAPFIPALTEMIQRSLG